MFNATAPILPLSAEVAAQIKSSTAITSLGGVAIGLIENSLDAGARKIEVSVDFCRGGCIVEDDGKGISPLEFSESGGLGRRYHTSKNDSLRMVHGGEGAFLSSLAALSVLTVTSHHEAYHSHASLILHHSKPAARLIPAPAHHHLSNREHGTRITVQDLFGNMPVRVKQRAITYGNREHEKQWEVLSRQVVRLLLAWNMPVLFTLSSPGSARKLCIRGREGQSFNPSANEFSPGSLDLSLIRSILCQAAYIEPSAWDEWIETSARTTFVAIHGAISLQPAPSKKAQFLSLGIQYINPEANNLFYDYINQIFAASNFGKQEEIIDSEENRKKLYGKDRKYKENGFTNKQLKGGGKRVDRWPMFFLRMDLQSQSNSGYNSGSAGLDIDNALSSISSALEAMIVGFLKDHHLRPRTRGLRKNLRVASELASGADRCSFYQFGKPPGNGTKWGTSSCPDFPIGLSESNTHRNAWLPAISGKIAERDYPAADALSSNVNFSNFSRRNIRPDEGFCSWSRIKSGRRDGSKELISRPKPMNVEYQQSRNNQRKDNTTTLPPKNLNHHVRGKLDASNGSRMTEMQPVKHAAYQSLDGGEDEIDDEDKTAPSLIMRRTTIAEYEDIAEQTISWTNPISGATFLIDARTGLVVPRIFEKLPSTSRPESALAHGFGAPVKQKRQARPLSPPLGTLGTGLWAKEFLKTWHNPVFSPSEESVPYVSFDGNKNSCNSQGRNHRSSDADIQTAFTESSSLFSAKLSKDSLSGAHVIAQVDKKFILISMKLERKRESLDNRRSISPRLLVLVDQHAADERVRIEGLLGDLCSTPEPGKNIVPLCVHPVSQIATTVLAKPIIFEIQSREYNLFTRHAPHFANWGILYGLSTPLAKGPSENSQRYQLAVKALPGGIAERCRIDAKVLIDLMRREVWKREERGIILTDSSEKSSTLTTAMGAETDRRPPGEPDQDGWLRRIKDCPQGILDMLNSRSCRSAIMFNDELTVEECRTLIEKLATCMFPFQCAHGRPSMAPLMQSGSKSSCLDNGIEAFGSLRELVKARMGELDFVQACKAWRNEMGTENQQMDQV